MAGCFAPIMKHLPVHSEMYRELCSGASPAEVSAWWERRMPDGSGIDPAIAPGGFAESCFSNAPDKKTVEYHYLKGRLGFVKLAILNKADIAPLYCFGINNYYRNIPWLKGARARLSQKILFGLNWPFGKYGTFLPMREETTAVWFPPFSVTKYGANQLEEAHAAYLEHLRTHFDAHKADYGMAGCELKFVGRDYVDQDSVAQFLRKLGFLGVGPRSKL